MPEMIPGSAPDSSPVPPPAGPAAAPMTNPTQQEGMKAQAAQGLQLATKLMEAALLAFGSMTPEGKHILTAIKSLDKVAGPSGGADLNQAEVKMLAAKAGPENAPGGGAAGMPKPPMGGGMPMAGPSPIGI